MDEIGVFFFHKLAQIIFVESRYRFDIASYKQITIFWGFSPWNGERFFYPWGKKNSTYWIWGSNRCLIIL